jgi:hypothetical protein
MRTRQRDRDAAVQVTAQARDAVVRARCSGTVDDWREAAHLLRKAHDQAIAAVREALKERDG